MDYDALYYSPSSSDTVAISRDLREYEYSELLLAFPPYGAMRANYVCIHTYVGRYEQRVSSRRLVMAI